MHAVVVGAIVAVIGFSIFGALTIIPSSVLGSALTSYNVEVDVGFTEVSFVVGTYFNVNSVSGQTTGVSAIISLVGAGIGLPAIESTFTGKVCVGSNHCATISSGQWFPSVPFVNGATLTASDAFHIGNVPAGTQPISVTLSQGGSVVATGSGAVCVGSGGGC